MKSYCQILVICAILQLGINSEEVNAAIASTGCIAPIQPMFGKYATEKSSHAPGDLLPQGTLLKYSCNVGYSIDGLESVICSKDGTWTSDTTCKKMCSSLRSHTLDLDCSLETSNVDCNNFMKEDTIVRAKACKTGYLPADNFNTVIECENGKWNNSTPYCEPDCAIDRYDYYYNNEFPWHVGIYSVLNSEEPMQICGGTIIRANIIVSAAHCFWNEKKKELHPSSLFFVAAGKLLRGYTVQENSAQRSEVIKIEVPISYGGSDQNQQSDIAMVMIKTPFEFSDDILPACLELSNNVLEKEQTEVGQMGKVPGWGETETGLSSNKLLMATLPVVDHLTCKKDVPEYFLKYLTNDKMCAGTLNGAVLCNGDSGGGLVFRAYTEDTIKWHMRGVASVPVPVEGTVDTCRNDTYSIFTHVWKHVDFIKEVLIDNQI